MTHLRAPFWKFASTHNGQSHKIWAPIMIMNC